MYNYLFHVLITFLVINQEEVLGYSSRILGGVEAPPKYGKFHASIQNLTGHHVCGGAVVSEWHVVTAAHCVHGANPAFMNIVVGTNNLETGGIQYDVVDIIVYDNYNTSSREHDIALLAIKEPFDLRSVRILRLGKHELMEGDEIILTGFGAQEPNGLSSTVMQTLNLTVFNQEICEYAMRYATTPVTREMFCTFSQIGQGTCHGDSGSPLVKGNEIVGVVSWGYPCAVGFPDVHTRISSYVPWILQHTCIPPRRQTIFEKITEIAKHMPEISKKFAEFLKMDIHPSSP
ncbi:chymotrypsin-1-like isoform X1 [Anticarsia gemmatalis]|uniref:chymotrypsin-1-like isoform X1 n=1 Tax=Anticarsia gemmatalis TaxID=129554 RepID=UPI003F772A87